MSLTGDYDSGNIFAKIIRGEAPCCRVYETQDVLAFMDLFPQSPGHLLVLPKGIAARNLLDLPPDRLPPLMDAVQRLARAVVEALRPDGVVITQFNGAPAGQTVFHLHFHIIPRWSDIPLGRHGQGGPADAEILKEQASRIAAALV